VPHFGSRSLANLATCHADAQIIMSLVIEEFDCSIVEGHRPQALQDDYFARGLSKVRTGKHNLTPSMAWHALPYFATKPHVDWNHRESMQHLAGYIRATAFGLLMAGHITHTVRWGGDWDRDFDVRETQWDDFAHYELEKP